MKPCVAMIGLVFFAAVDLVNAAEPSKVPGRQTKTLEGWTLLLSEELLEKDKASTERALELLAVQLQEVVRVVPAPAVAELRKVPLWFSPEYPGVQPRAEYHPSAGWLRDNNRDPAMEKGVEFTNLRIFERETKRMPNFALHELAHAYHDRVLAQGFGNEDIKAAFETVKEKGLYERVEQRFGDGRSANVRAYAITNPMEYFAECSEAFFSTNDFFPFTREQLAKHDPGMFVLLKAVWGEPAKATKIASVAGTGQAEDGGAGGPARTTNIGEPFGVDVGPDGGLYITEVRNHRVRRLDLKSGELTTVAGNGKKGYSGDGGPATEASLNEPYEVRFDKSGNMYFVEMQNHLIRMVDAKTGVIRTLAGTGQSGFGGDGGPATKATFRQPHSIALDDAGNVYVADIGNHRIRRIDTRTGIIDSIAGNGDKQMPVDGTPAADNPVLGPRSLCFDDGTLWVCLREGNSVWGLDLAGGKWRHVAGTGQQGFSGDDGPAKDATFAGPKGIALGKDQALYVADTENEVIRRIDLRSGKISTIAGVGPKAKGPLGDGGPASEALLARPHGVCVGPDGAVYIGDTNHHRVRRVAACE